MSHCAQDLTCPNRCRCSEELKAELEAELALLDAQDDEGTGSHEEAESAPEAGNRGLRGAYGLMSAIRTRGN